MLLCRKTASRRCTFDQNGFKGAESTAEAGSRPATAVAAANGHRYHVLTGSSVTTMCGRCIIQAGIAPAPLLQLPGPKFGPPNRYNLCAGHGVTRCARCGSDLSPVTAQAAPHDLLPSHTRMPAAGDLNRACVMPQTQGKSGRCFSRNTLRCATKS